MQSNHLSSGISEIAPTASIPSTGLSVSNLLRYFGAPAAITVAGFAGTVMPNGGFLGTAAPPKPPTAQVVRTRETREADFLTSDIQRQATANLPAGTSWDSSVSALSNAARRIFDHVSISLNTHKDPDEGWQRNVLTIVTGIQDIDQRMDAEDRFYAAVDADLALRDALRFTVVVFS